MFNKSQRLLSHVRPFTTRRIFLLLMASESILLSSADFGALKNIMAKGVCGRVCFPHIDQEAERDKEKGKTDAL